MTKESRSWLKVVAQEAREAWPDLDLDESGFFDVLVERFPEETTPPTDAARVDWVRDRAGDLYLTYGCATGDASALAAFERHYGSFIAGLAHRFAGRIAPEDLGQTLRERLFVGQGGRPPRIADYNGQGLLKNWIRVTATRTFLNLLRSHRGSARELPTDEQDLVDVAHAVDPELDFLKRRYLVAFKTAFAQAVDSLDGQQRALLRYQVLEGLSSSQISVICDLHPRSVTRHLAKARATLLKATRQQLGRRLNLEHQEFESIMRLIASRMDVSLHRLLLTQEADSTNSEDSSK